MIIFNFLEDIGFKKTLTQKLPKGKYDMKQTFRSDTDNESVEIIYGSKHSYLPVLLKIHDLNRELLSSLDSFFRYHGIMPKVSEIELTFDFFTADILGLYKFLKAHLFQKHSRTKFDNIEYHTTFYTDDRRKTKTKAGIVYLRPKIGKKEYVRMEFVLKRPLIRRLGLELTLRNIDSLRIDRFFTFIYLNKLRIFNYLVWKHRQQIKEAEERRKGSGSLLKFHILSYLSGMVDEEETLMSNVWELKSEKELVPNYSRFLEPLHDVNRVFFEKASNQKFIPDGCLASLLYQERKISKTIIRPLKIKKVLS